MAGRDAVIQTHELSKIYRHPFFTWVVRARALTDLTITIQQGQIYGLLGPNGSGKSTTIKLILGLLFPTRGQVAVFGKRPDDMVVKKRLGFLPEESSLYKFLDAEETLDFYGRLFGIPRVERQKRISSLLELTGLTRQRKRLVSEYSKGMQRRIGLAQSLINDPDLLILDEPTSGLDPIGIREVKDIILQMKSMGKTVLLSSHLLADVEDTCDRIAILYGGRLQAEGTVSELLRQEKATQITADMDSETKAEVLHILRSRLGETAEIKIAPPQERLEQYFMRVIEEARDAKTVTSGAEMSTSHKLDFLTAATGSDLLEQLTQSDLEPAVVTKTVTPVDIIDDKAEADKILADLLQTTETKKEINPEKSTTGESQKSAVIEHREEESSSILDKLLKPE